MSAERECNAFSAFTLPLMCSRFPRPSSSSAFTDVNESRHLSDLGFELLEGLLCLDPQGRLSAERAIAHPWFAEDPLPRPRSRMPNFPTKVS